MPHATRWALIRVEQFTRFTCYFQVIRYQLFVVVLKYYLGPVDQVTVYKQVVKIYEYQCKFTHTHHSYTYMYTAIQYSTALYVHVATADSRLVNLYRSTLGRSTVLWLAVGSGRRQSSAKARGKT